MNKTGEEIKEGVACHQEMCKEFILTHCIFRNAVAFCLRCGKMTCVKCKGKDHGTGRFRERCPMDKVRRAN